MSNPIGKANSLLEAIQQAQTHLKIVRQAGGTVTEVTEAVTIDLFVKDWIANQLQKRMLKSSSHEELDRIMALCEELGFTDRG